MVCTVRGYPLHVSTCVPLCQPGFIMNAKWPVAEPEDKVVSRKQKYLNDVSAHARALYDKQLKVRLILHVFKWGFTSLIVPLCCLHRVVARRPLPCWTLASCMPRPRIRTGSRSC